MTTLNERMASVEEWIEGHEARCEERLAGIGRELRDIKTAQANIQKTAWGVLASLACFLALQVYDGLKVRPAAAAQAAVVVTPPAAPPTSPPAGH